MGLNVAFRRRVISRDYFFVSLICLRRGILWKVVWAGMEWKWDEDGNDMS